MLKDKEMATGKWPDILAALGIGREFLRKKHGPCPICGGKDRFRFDDKGGRGTFICNQDCGAGDGYRLLERYHGWSFREAIEQVERIAGGYKPAIAAKSSDDAMPAVRRIWDECVEISDGDPACKYLKNRTKFTELPRSLAFHPALKYIDDDGEITHHPAIVAAICGPDGKGVGIHRIYLSDDGGKANVSSPKKLLKGRDLSGAAVRLARHGEHLGIAEGIETAIAAQRIHGVPAWAAISAGLMEQWSPPQGVTKVTVFGDNDASYTGQAAAFSLAKRLVKAGIAVDVLIPEQVGQDWADL